MATAGDRPEGSPVGRRAVLGMLGLGVAGVLFGKEAQHAVTAALHPLTSRDPTGLSAALPGSGGFQIYAELGSPTRSDVDYRLTVNGLVDRSAVYDLAQLRTQLPQTKLVKDFQCVTGWRVEKVPWEGVKLSDILERLGVKPSATHLRFFSFDGGYTETLTLEQARRPDVVVAHHMLGQPVTQAHGGPVRLYVAPMYGYKSCKWLERIEVVAGESPTGYWEQNGYDVDGWVGRSNGRVDPAVN